MDLLNSNSQYIRWPLSVFLAARKGIETDFVLQTPHFYCDSFGYTDPAPIRAALEREGSRVRCVTPLPYRYSICAGPGTMQRERTIGYYRRCLEATAEFGAEYLCITGAGGEYDADPDALRESCAENLSTLSDYASQTGVTMLLGSVMGQESAVNACTPVLLTLQEIRDMLVAVDSPALCAYTDTQVIGIAGERLSDWLSTFGNRLRLIRLTDGNYNGYRVWGKGCLPLEPLLEEMQSAGFDGLVSLQIPGERYSDDPVRWEAANHTYVSAALKGADR